MKRKYFSEDTQKNKKKKKGKDEKIEEKEEFRDQSTLDMSNIDEIFKDIKKIEINKEQNLGNKDINFEIQRRNKKEEEEYIMINNSLIKNDMSITNRTNNYDEYSSEKDIMRNEMQSYSEDMNELYDEGENKREKMKEEMEEEMEIDMNNFDQLINKEIKNIKKENELNNNETNKKYEIKENETKELNNETNKKYEIKENEENFDNKIKENEENIQKIKIQEIIIIKSLTKTKEIITNIMKNKIMIITIILLYLSSYSNSVKRILNIVNYLIYENYSLLLIFMNLFLFFQIIFLKFNIFNKFLKNR
jgi:hypothetical protein